jgi:hypothetical protein
MLKHNFVNNVISTLCSSILPQRMRPTEVTEHTPPLALYMQPVVRRPTALSDPKSWRSGVPGSTCSLLLRACVYCSSVCNSNVSVCMHYASEKTEGLSAGNFIAA